MAHIFYIVALLCFASCVVENTETAQRFKDLHLQQDSLPWLEETQDKQESTKNLIDLLYKLSKFENGNILQEPTDIEEQEKNRRALGKTTRRFGCRMFFWKAWAAC
uniref:Somatostatin/Cortistatin C-terminal domain-containing protein n=1 Tax=Sander lucioperca TaxID=283035 RepID=A0A8D0DCV5_SANLU